MDELQAAAGRARGRPGRAREGDGLGELEAKRRRAGGREGARPARLAGGTGDWRGRMRTQGLHGAQMPGRAAREEDGAEDAGLEEQGGARRPWEAGARA
jgi:hypothetical protein